MIFENCMGVYAGWRKISFYFDLSYEIRDKTIGFDDNRNVRRAEFIVRAHMQYVFFSFHVPFLE